VIRFKFLTGDVNWMDYGGKWVSNKLNNGEFDYWLVIELINMDDACGRDNKGQPKYCVELCAVSPSQAGENLNAAIRSCGYAPEDNNGKIMEVTPLMAVEMLHSYGTSGHLWSSQGNNAHRLLREARSEARGSIDGLLEKTVNKIGTTALEAMQGNLLGGLSRTIASGSTEGRILAKMYGVTPPPEHEVTFGTLQPDGQLTNVRLIKQSSMTKCKFFIMDPRHYRDDQSCRCDDPEHRKMMIVEWGYSEEDFTDIPLREQPTADAQQPMKGQK
jgi:hypothetical protein